MEPLQTWWTTELYPTSDEDNFGVVGNFEVVKAADAQATIAALQARVQVKELEADRSAWKEIAQDWSAAAKLAEQPEKFYDGYSAAVMNAMQALLTKARADLARVTAELEAVKAELEQERVRLAGCLIAAEGGTKDIVKHGDYGWSPAYQATLNLQAELERVRGELVEATHNVNVYQSLYSTSCMDRALLENELRDLREQNRVLVKALDDIRKKSYEPDPERPELSTRAQIQLMAEAALTATSQEGQR